LDGLPAQPHVRAATSASPTLFTAVFIAIIFEIFTGKVPDFSVKAFVTCCRHVVRKDGKTDLLSEKQPILLFESVYLST
jgi:hypothetical protein